MSCASTRRMLPCRRSPRNEKTAQTYRGKLRIYSARNHARKLPRRMQASTDGGSAALHALREHDRVSGQRGHRGRTWRHGHFSCSRSRAQPRGGCRRLPLRVLPRPSRDAAGVYSLSSLRMFSTSRDESRLSLGRSACRLRIFVLGTRMEKSLEPWRREGPERRPRRRGSLPLRDRGTKTRRECDIASRDILRVREF